MRTHFHSGGSLLIASAIAAAATVFGLSPSLAQEKHKFTTSNAAAQTKYTQQHVIEVGDVPDHQVRVYELHYMWPTNPPMYGGVSAVEGWARGQSDYSSGNGRSWGYYLEILENGDRIFWRYDGTAQATVNADGSMKRVYHGVATITGGTGKFRGIRGMSRNTVIFDPKTSYNEGQTEVEYWTE